MKTLKLILAILGVFITSIGLTSFVVIAFNIELTKHEKISISNSDMISSEIKSEYELAKLLHGELDKLKSEKNIDQFLSDVKNLVIQGANPFYETVVSNGKKSSKISFMKRLYNHFSFIDENGVPLRSKVIELLVENGVLDIEIKLNSYRDLLNMRDLFFMDINSIRNKEILLSYLLSSSDSKIISLRGVQDVKNYYRDLSSVSAIKQTLNKQFLEGVLKFNKKEIAYFSDPSKLKAKKI